MVNFIRTIQIILWAFLGIRKKEEFNKDIQVINPITLIFVGIFLTLLFVIGLVLLIKYVVLA
jgi:Protein of unknown function (DUF2970)